VKQLFPRFLNRKSSFGDHSGETAVT